MWLQGYSVVADLLKVSDCKRTVEEAVAKMDGLDILVNCGGVWTDAIMSDHLGEQGFSDAFKMHVITPAQLIEEAIPHLSKNKVHCQYSTVSECSSEECSSEGCNPVSPPGEGGLQQCLRDARHHLSGFPSHIFLWHRGLAGRPH